MQTIWSHGLVCVEFIKSRVCDMEASFSCLKTVSSPPLPCLLVGNILPPQYHPHRLLLWSSPPSSHLPSSPIQELHISELLLHIEGNPNLIFHMCPPCRICIHPLQHSSHSSYPTTSQLFQRWFGLLTDGNKRYSNVYFMSPGSSHTLSGLSWHPRM